MGRLLPFAFSDREDDEAGTSGSDSHEGEYSPGLSAIEGVPLQQPLDPEEFRKYAYQMVDFLADYYSTVADYPVRSQVAPGYLAPLLPSDAPTMPDSFQDVMADVQTKIIPGITHWQSPSFFAYFGAPASTASLLGDMLSSGLNIVGFSWIASPAATELEIVVLNWLGKMLNLPSKFLSPGPGGGVLQGTTCEAVLVTLVAARDRVTHKLAAAQGLPAAAVLERLVVYASDQAHCMVIKSSKIAGILPENIRILPTTAAANFALAPETLRQAVAEDLASGLIPFFLAATVGTTSSGAVDPIGKLGVIANDNSMWFHVDAAYAGSACICPEYQHHLDGLQKADSFSFNAHKWLLTTFGCCCLWVQDSEPLVAALTTNAEYLRNKATEAKLVTDFKDWQVPLSRGFRALKLWMVLRMHGTTGLRAYIRSQAQIAKHFESLVLQDSRFEVLVPTLFSLVCFRLKPPSGDKDNGYALNTKLLDALNSKGTCFLTHTVLSGVYTIRLAVGSTLSQECHVEAAWAGLQEEATRLLNVQTSDVIQYIETKDLCSCADPYSTCRIHEISKAVEPKRSAVTLWSWLRKQKWSRSKRSTVQLWSIPPDNRNN